MAHTIPVPSNTNEGEVVPVLNGRLLHRLTHFNVVLTNRDEVEAYVANHPDLAPLLEGVCVRLREAFGERAELALEFYKDPEQQDRYPVLYVRQSSYEAGILNQIEAVICPFLPQLEDSSGHLLVTTDFRRPRG